MWFNRRKGSSGSKSVSKSDAIVQIVERTQAVIHFTPEGVILEANDMFLRALGYTAAEVVGQHHSMFVQKKYRQTQAYQDFWNRLRAGEFFTDEFPRITKEDEVIWISATYAPVFDEDGTVVQITKIATEITRQREAIRAISKGLQALSNGDLTHRVELSAQDRMKEVADSFNAASENMANLIRQVKDVAGTIDGMSQRVSGNADELSRRTETQAATLEQTAAAVDQLNHTARKAADYASEVGREAQDTRKAAGDSSKVVEDVTAAMQRIEDSSKSISQIVSVIDDIAFQTNLLALNAGVEAARAGEAGRGFAVVASEVRQLAQRSADSAKEIKSLIVQSSEYVRDGATLVGKASGDLGGIFRSVDRISERIREVVSGLQEQTITLTEINTAISHLDTVTQQNAAMVSETAGVTLELSKNSASLSDGISIFTVAPTDVTLH
ncbi:methyl-accepting chemotaxis protein [Rhodovulum kholense]|uniref:Methyl-accepting chemotaxis sensory transducer with Pas/Pac sensor n=1 Tax=Rhodovulum kholense TaxID=453584 RepID=A0A8E2VGV5_9RHOB|nr:methyl-accepting chemotaxis protein [Rhodovulum kholense]PTW33829.1 methyl-accepting chemotaxis sensory transducer with Pas/Pac sensor [Rhodovulum kholense]